MKIGIDAKWFYEGPPSGRVVVRNLIKHLVELSSNDEFYIFLDRKSKGMEFPYQRPNVYLHYVWAGNNMLSNVFIIPISSYDLHLDIFIFQNFVPVICNSIRYAVVYDVLFESYPNFFSRVELLYFWPIKYLAFFASRICTISETEKLRLAEYRYKETSCIDVIYLGVDEVFVPREFHEPSILQKVTDTYGLPPCFILYVGRLNVRKNIFNLLKALSLMNNSSIPLVIVGGYEGKMTSLNSIIADLGIGDRVIFTGHVSDEDLPRIISLAKVFCFVSYAEAFGLPALEAMAAGIPVVTSNRTCLPEICADAALYVNPDNPAEIAQMIDRLLNDQDLWKEKRELGANRARGFSWRASAKKLLSSVRKAVEKGRIE